jgi:mono/diheme cytochrome c family protein
VLRTVRPVRRSTLLATLTALLSLVLACDRGEVREWTPADHDQEDLAAQGQPAGSARGPRRGTPAEEAAQVVEVTWSRQCATCHGPEGHGDGPSGPMVNAPDLTRKDWLASTSDEQIGRTIVEGRGKMPKFALPPVIVSGLVKRIRQPRGR